MGIVREETIAYCLKDLAYIYQKKLGNDDFVIQICDKAIEYNPRLVHSKFIQCSYYQDLYKKQVAKGITDENKFYVKMLLSTIMKLNAQLDELGVGKPMKPNDYQKMYDEIEYGKKLEQNSQTNTK